VMLMYINRSDVFVTSVSRNCAVLATPR
jgi:hypothetical protein